MRTERGFEVLETDVLVVGSEGAGGRAAIAAFDAGAKVIIATKGRVGRTGATVTAGADYTVDGKSAKEICGLSGDERDSPDRYFKDIVTEGLFLNNQELVQDHVDGAPIVLKELMDWGMEVFFFESAHHQEMARGAITSGPIIMRTIRNQVRKRKIRVLEDVMVLDLLIESGRVAGAVALDLNKGEIIVIQAKAVILATGGWQRAWSFSIAPHELTGDGPAMAYRAGAEVIDMEMVQFAPGVLIWPPRFKGGNIVYILDLLLGEDEGELLNNRGERFMEKYDPERMEHTSKEIWSLAITSEVLAGRGTPHGGVWWSFKGVDKKRIKEVADREKGRVFWAGGAEEIIQMALDGVDYEVGAGVVYNIGGIRVNAKTETNVAGLYAAGECKGNMWGATRVASAITEVIVEGRSSGAIAADHARHCTAAGIDWEQVEAIREKTLRPLEKTKGLSPIELRKSIQRIADDQVHVIRNGEDLKKAVQELEQLKDPIANNVAVKGTKTRSYNPEWIEAIQLENLRQCLELTALSSLHREESRGAQYRTDYRNCDNVKWLNNTVVRLESGSRKISSEPIVTTKITPPQRVMTYMEALGLELASLKEKTRKER